MQITSWNVNGVRAAAKNGMLEWLSYDSPDILCMQEVKAEFEDLDDVLKKPFDYETYWFSGKKKGYSGLGVYTRVKPLDVIYGLGEKKFDDEARVLTLKFEKFYLINTYFPNSQRDHARLGYKLEFCESIQEYCKKIIKDGGNLVLCGDFNVAHKEIDLANPKSNQNNAGFLPEERAWMEQFTQKDFVDTFRIFEKGPGHYSWWSYRPGVREKNIGWRIDYHVVNEKFKPAVKKSIIQPEVMGSDHCPVSITLKL